MRKKKFWKQPVEKDTSKATTTKGLFFNRNYGNQGIFKSQGKKYQYRLIKAIENSL